MARHSLQHCFCVNRRHARLGNQSDNKTLSSINGHSPAINQQDARKTANLRFMSLDKKRGEPRLSS